MLRIRFRGRDAVKGMGAQAPEDSEAIARVGVASESDALRARDEGRGADSEGFHGNTARAGFGERFLARPGLSG
jgi:hypothetical protein